MAEVTSGKLTTIVLNSVEASALADLLEINSNPGRGWKDLDDLANAMIGVDYD